MDATEQALLVRSGKVSAAELLEAAIERIRALNPSINAVTMEWFDHARSLVADGSPGGPFGGVPFLLKDFMAPYAGQPMSNGNARLKSLAALSEADSTLVARFRAAGLVTAGRTNSPEFATMATTEPAAWGPTRNPWNLDRSTGGSSGGATAAVAAGLVPVAHASDGSGSIRIPSALCGVVGLKPSRGRISAGPLADESGPAVALGVSRTVRDTAAMLDALSGPSVGDLVVAPPPQRPYRHELEADPAPLRIGLLDRTPQGDPVHPDCAEAVHATARLLDELGHHVEQAHPAALEQDAVGGRSPIALAATGPLLASFRHLEAALGREVTAADVEPFSWAIFERIRGIPAYDYAEAMAAAARYRREVQRWWADGYDLLLTPTTAQPAPPIGSYDGDLERIASLGANYIVFTRPFNVTGQPAISLPLNWSRDGMPIGVQLVAAYAREDVLLSVSAQLERARPWHQRTPPA
ncbi:amidase [Pseudonocardia acaciae]|uniref:amidase n=1 Tax=Pseudonocardia acaciae TaxID=551276 RepID=UPI000A9500CC|nr:amidase [Pseudonocardia acaciae]